MHWIVIFIGYGVIAQTTELFWAGFHSSRDIIMMADNLSINDIFVIETVNSLRASDAYMRQ